MDDRPDFPTATLFRVGRRYINPACIVDAEIFAGSVTLTMCVPSFYHGARQITFRGDEAAEVVAHLEDASAARDIAYSLADDAA